MIIIVNDIIANDTRDESLKLKIENDSGRTFNEAEIKQSLNNFDLILKLTNNFNKNPLFNVWRIIALSEIPYTIHLDYTKKVIDYIEKNLSTPNGFSLSGKETDLLPCYDAMIIEAFSKLGHTNSKHLKDSVEGIKNYQSFDRNSHTSWKGKGIQKYRGCLKQTPCYIGVASQLKH